MATFYLPHILLAIEMNRRASRHTTGLGPEKGTSDIANIALKLLQCL